MAGRPLRPATRRRLGRPSPHQQADRPRAHPTPKNLSTHTHAGIREYRVLAPVSEGYPKVQGRLLTCYSPVRRSSTPKGLSARLACVKHAASVRPEPGSNSPLRSHDSHNNMTAKPRTDNPGKKILAKGIQNQTTPKRGRLVEDQKALAFSTLLSSQETDTHHQGPNMILSGATPLTYHPQPASQHGQNSHENHQPGIPPTSRPPQASCIPSSRGDPYPTV